MKDMHISSLTNELSTFASNIKGYEKEIKNLAAEKDEQLRHVKQLTANLNNMASEQARER